MKGTAYNEQVSKLATNSKKFRELGKNLAALCFGLLLALLVGELLVRQFLPQQFPVHPRGMYVRDAAVGYALTPGFSGTVQRSEFATTVTINSMGFRGPEIPAITSSTYRILLLGDSMAWGFGVEDNETVAVQLESLLNQHNPDLDIQVINASVPGYGTADQLNLLQAHIKSLKPDLVLVQFFSINDLAENQAPATGWAVIEDGMLAAAESGTDPDQGLSRAERVLFKIKGSSQLVNLVSNSVGYLLTRYGMLATDSDVWGEGYSQEQGELGTALLIDIANLAADHSAETVLLYTTGQSVVIQPTYEQLNSAGVVAEAAAGSGAEWLDVSELLQERPDRTSLFYAQDGHWTALGHLAVAEIIADHLDPLP